MQKKHAMKCINCYNCIVEFDTLVPHKIYSTFGILKTDVKLVA